MCLPSGLHCTATSPAKPSSILHVQSGFSSDQTYKVEEIIFFELSLTYKDLHVNGIQVLGIHLTCTFTTGFFI